MTVMSAPLLIDLGQQFITSRIMQKLARIIILIIIIFILASFFLYRLHIGKTLTPARQNHSSSLLK